ATTRRRTGNGTRRCTRRPCAARWRRCSRSSSREWGAGKIFRPYRDVRFSTDKSPYKTNIAAMIGDGYLQLNADGLAAGCGMYVMEPDQLARFRQAVDDDRAGRELEAIVAHAHRAGLEVTAHEA